jgi:hypothetical protein
LGGEAEPTLDAQFAEEALGDVLAHVAAAAEDLDGAVGHPVGHLRAVELDHRALGVRGLHVGRVAVDAAGGLVQHRAGREQLGHAVREHARHQAVRGDRDAAGDPRPRERGHLRDQAVGRAGAAGGDHQPLEAEPLARVEHAAALVADEVGGRDADVGELDDRVMVADRVGVRGGADDADAGGGQVDQEEQVLGGRVGGGWVRHRGGVGGGVGAGTTGPFGMNGVDLLGLEEAVVS